jgi:hypothetical protein
MIVKTSELIGAQLDWAVAKAEGREIKIRPDCIWIPSEPYSRDWAHMGPIIERESINTCRLNDLILSDGNDGLVKDWVAHIDGLYASHGPTPLIAAARCFVAGKLGSEVDVPEGLV